MASFEYPSKKDYLGTTIVILLWRIQMQTIPAKVTERLVMELDELVKQGWYASRSEAIRDAIRELVKKTKLDRLEQAIREDIRWGLYGAE